MTDPRLDVIPTEHYTNQRTIPGWQCPVCSQVNAPWVAACPRSHTVPGTGGNYGLPRWQTYEPCVIGSDGSCTRSSHDHSEEQETTP